MKGYYRVKNNHIFVQSVDADTMDSVKKLMLINNQHIHIFELHIPAINNVLESIVKSVTNRCKLTIHIPKEMKDYKTYLEHRYADINTNWHIELHGRRKIDFIIKRKYDGVHGLLVRFTHHDGMFGVSSERYVMSDSYEIPAHVYYLSNRQSYIQTRIQLAHPDLFKDEIIKNFKKVTPKEILSGFKTDDDIWNFILEELEDGKDEQCDYAD